MSVLFSGVSTYQSIKQSFELLKNECDNSQRAIADDLAKRQGKRRMRVGQADTDVVAPKSYDASINVQMETLLCVADALSHLIDQTFHHKPVPTQPKQLECIIKTYQNPSCHKLHDEIMNSSVPIVTAIKNFLDTLADQAALFPDSLHRHITKVHTDLVSKCPHQKIESNELKTGRKHYG